MRSARKISVVPFVSKLEKNCETNLNALIQRARKLELEGFENVKWKDSIWTITGGRLIKQTGKNVSSVSINFYYLLKRLVSVTFSVLPISR